MKKISYLLVIFIFLSACKSNKGGEEGTTISSSSTESSNGLSYKIHTQGKGDRSPKIGDFITLNMQYGTESDSIIFSSYKKDRPLSFKFQKTLFKGVLNEGLEKMTVGDSATFLVAAKDLYGERMPKFLKEGDNIKYTISLQKVQTQEEYQKERKDQRSKQELADKIVVKKFLTDKKLKPTTEKSGLQHVIQKKGNKKKPTSADKVMAKYTVTLASTGAEVETTDGKEKEIILNRQIKGLREGLQLLGEGGKATFIIPSTLAYGDRKRGNIPANAVLVYDIEITKVEAVKK